VNFKNVFKIDPQHLILPPARQPVGPNRDLRVIGYYSESNVQVGCGPTHPSVRVILKKIDDDTKVIQLNFLFHFSSFKRPKLKYR
jgi:hypothetical protein